MQVIRIKARERVLAGSILVGHSVNIQAKTKNTL
jgi:hypothetical protein